MENKLGAININPSIWGPLFWKLLDTLAKYKDMIPKSAEDELKHFVSHIPNTLPCNECRKHCVQTYLQQNMEKNISLSTLREWVWTLRTETNKNTNKTNTTYTEYLLKLGQPGYSINEIEILELLSMITNSYPHDEPKRKHSIYKFIIHLIKLISWIPHLNTLKYFLPEYEWKNKLIFQKWLHDKSLRIYNHHLNFNY